MENIEYSFMVREMQELTGKRFEKIQEIEKGKLSLKIGKERIVIELGKRMNIAYKIESGESRNNFIQKTRKELKGFKFRRVFQHNSDRIMVFVFELRGEEKSLIFEMFAKGNAILVQEGEILGTYKREKWADREIKPGMEYKFPKSNIVTKLRDAVSDKYIVSCMMRLPLGKKYVREILARVGIDEKTPGNELKESEIDKIDREIGEIRKNLSPLGFYENNGLVDYGLVEFLEYKNLDKKRFSGLSEVADRYYSRTMTEEKSGKIKKLEKRLREQEELLEELREKEKKYKEIGDAIYKEYSKIEEILEKEGKKRKEIEIEI